MVERILIMTKFIEPVINPKIYLLYKIILFLYEIYMFSKIKKLPILLILALLLAVSSSGFAYYEYKELQNFKDAGLYYDKNQKQVVLSPQSFATNSSTRYLGINELKDFMSYKINCPVSFVFIAGDCNNPFYQNQNNNSSGVSGYASQNTFSAPSSPTSEIIKAKYYGWFGSDKVEFTINTPVQNFKYNGEYYSNSEKKTFNFVGNVSSQQNNGSYKSSISLEENVDGLITGKIELFSQDNTNKLAGLSNDAIEKLSTENLFGTYTAKDQKQYDIFLTNKKETIESWKVKEIKGKYYKASVYGGGISPNAAMITGENINYFSNETWNFKDLVDGQEVVIKGKTRQYSSLFGNAVATYQPQFDNQNCGYAIPCTPKTGYPAAFSTDIGIFNIESVNKV